ncbi:divergent polysaccharide deacteylase family protein [Thalassococcus sp. S3]|uniref:divergent polysaccharide deacteylase family protein n=1 Tax=Thalassococcus sp. S3 TaxID=2017482 RepID=UPI0020C588CB|nr:divergent polysaccharide deacteylase family protein [Thalassococcus sp. S3]
MARGFLSGLIWGGVVAVGGAAVASLVTDLPESPDVADRAPDGAAQVAPLEAGTGTNPEPGGPAGRVDGVSAVGPDVPAPDAMAQPDTDPAGVPQIGEVAEGLGEPGPAGNAPQVSTTGAGARAAPGTPATAPQAPEAETELSISTEPAQPTLPEVVEDNSGFDPEPADEDTEAPSVTEPDPAPSETAEAEGVQAEDNTAEAQAAEQAEGTDPAGSESAAAVPDEPEVATEAPEAPRVAALPEAGEGPRIGERVVPLTERGGATNRLPSVGDAPPEDAPEPVSPPEVVAGPPIEAFAVRFENPEQKPLMGIVLIDDADAVGAEALGTFPYPLSFAVDVTAPDAEEKMARHRANGFEVIAMVNLPASAAPSDAEVAFEAGLAAVPEAVAVMEGPGEGVQGNRALSDQITQIVKASGHGLIMQDNGLNTAQKLAAREGVPSSVVFRDFDGAGQTPTVMRRFLDQAAFRAGQQGGVIMMGRVRPDTISALLLWGLQDRASRVALAPISAVLTQAPAE